MKLTAMRLVAVMTVAATLLSGCTGGSSAGEAPRTMQQQSSPASVGLGRADDPPPVEPTTADPTLPETTLPETTVPETTVPERRLSSSPVGSSSPTAAAAAAQNLPAAPPTGSAVRISTGERPSGFFNSEPGNFATGADEEALLAGSSLEQPILRERLEGYEPSLSGFPEDAQLVLQLTAPDGTSVTRHGSSSEDLRVVFTNEMPLGEWQVEVSATGFEDATARASVIVSRASSPDFYQTDDRAGATIELAGYPPRSTVNFFLYGPGGDDEASGFPRALPVAVTDRNGEATYSLDARASDPPGSYRVWFSPGCPTNTSLSPGELLGAACASFKK